MNIYTNTNSSFPSQVVSDAEKASLEYGIQVARAIEQEWFDQGRTNANRYQTNYNNFHQLRLYARGEQSIQKYKDELAINADIQAMNRLVKGKDVVSQDVSTRLRYMVQEVDGNNERGFINKWVQKCCLVMLFSLESEGS